MSTWSMSWPAREFGRLHLTRFVLTELFGRRRILTRRHLDVLERAAGLRAGGAIRVPGPCPLIAEAGLLSVLFAHG